MSGVAPATLSRPPPDARRDSHGDSLGFGGEVVAEARGATPLPPAGGLALCARAVAETGRASAVPLSPRRPAGAAGRLPAAWSVGMGSGSGSAGR